MKKRKFWTPREDRVLMDHYPDTQMQSLLEMLPGRTIHAIYHHAQKLGLKRSPGFIQNQLGELSEKLHEAGKAFRFPKGHQPANKGKRQSEYMSPVAIAKTQKTQFKPGHEPHNTKWDGAVSIRHGHKNRGASPYMWIRVSKGRWVQYQRWLWEKKNGPIPKNKLLVCKDGNTLNPDPENWEIITMAENARRNHNREKAAETMRQIHAGEKKPRKITPYQAATLLAGGDKEMRRHLLDRRPDLVRLAMANYNLKRTIRYANND